MSETCSHVEAPVLLELEAATEQAVIGRMIGLLAGHAAVRDLMQLERAVMERQKIQPPLLGSGVALPHARTPAVTELVLAIGRCREPVPFGPAGVPIRVVFLFGVPVHCIGGYLDAVAKLTRTLRKSGRIDALLAASNATEFRNLLQ